MIAGSKSDRNSPVFWKLASIAASTAAPASSAERLIALARDLDDRDEVIAVIAHEREARLDVGPERPRTGRLGDDPRSHVLLCLGEDLCDDRPDQILLAGEVVGDHALADPRPLGDASQRCQPITELGDRLNRRRDDLGATSLLDEGSVVLAARLDFRSDGQNLARMAKCGPTSL
jgi:hypothetical protein